MTVVVAAVSLGAGFLANQSNHEIPVSVARIGIALMIVPSILYAVAFPHIKVGFMARVWHLPKQTYLVSRNLLRLVGSSLLGQLIGTAVLAVFIQGLFLEMLALLVPTSIAFVYSAGRRLRKHPNSEFALSFPLRRPLSRSRRRRKV